MIIKNYKGKLTPLKKPSCPNITNTLEAMTPDPTSTQEVISPSTLIICNNLYKLSSYIGVCMRLEPFISRLY